MTTTPASARRWPLAELDGAAFLVISKKSPYRVGMWEHENGEIYAVWSSFADFASKVIDKRDKTPFAKFEKALDQAEKLIDGDKFARALALLAPYMKAPPKSADDLDDDYYTARAFNLFGLSLKGVKRLREARKAFEMAIEAGDEYAILNLLDLYEDTHDSQALIACALQARKRMQLDAYCQIWIARYLAVAYASIGRVARGTAELRAIADEYRTTEVDKLAAARTSIVNYLRESHPNKEAARGYVDLLAPKSRKPAKR